MGFFNLFNKKKEKEEVKERTPLNLEVNDIVEYDLEEYEVIGKITYNEGAYEWFDYHLDNGTESFWLYAEQDDRLELGLFETISPNNSIYKELEKGIPHTIQFKGETFSKIEEGEANIQVEGQVGAKSGQTMKYIDYESNNGNMISVEYWGNELEISFGEEVKESLLEFYPNN